MPTTVNGTFLKPQTLPRLLAVMLLLLPTVHFASSIVTRSAQGEGGIGEGAAYVKQALRENDEEDGIIDGQIVFKLCRTLVLPMRDSHSLPHP
jgi:hypothetical protein